MHIHTPLQGDSHILNEETYISKKRRERERERGRGREIERETEREREREREKEGDTERGTLFM